MTILAFFAATTQGGKVYIWIVLLGHCLLMALFFRPEKDQLGRRDLRGIQKTIYDQNSSRAKTDDNNREPATADEKRDKQHNSAPATRKWMRKSFLAVSLVFTQIFTFIPFKKSQTPEESSSRATYATLFYSVSISIIKIPDFSCLIS